VSAKQVIELPTDGGVEPLYTVDETARYLKLHPQTVRKMIRRGDLKSTAVGMRVRVRASDIRAYLDA
jgi:excisionase family DNA binding protein